MKVLLVDVDSVISNLALMKLSTFFKNNNYNVDIQKLKIPFYSHRKGKKRTIDASEYNMVFSSIIFKNNKNMLDIKNCNEIYYGGSGFNVQERLPNDIEVLDPDYSIYPEHDYQVGFITRGCIRNCYFCIVREKEGFLHKVNDVEYFAKINKPIVFLDNNILGYKKHKEIFKKIIDLNIKCEFKQGLDIRLIDEENAKLLKKMKYISFSYIFAFDDIKYKKSVEKGVSILKQAGFKKWQLVFYVYVHPNMPISDIKYRIEWLKKNECLPYIMRDESCYLSKNKNLYTNMAAWTNQPGFFKKLSFSEYLKIRAIKEDRQKLHSKIYNKA